MWRLSRCQTLTKGEGGSKATLTHHVLKVFFITEKQAREGSGIRRELKCAELEAMLGEEGLCIEMLGPILGRCLWEKLELIRDRRENRKKKEVKEWDRPNFRSHVNPNSKKGRACQSYRGTSGCVVEKKVTTCQKGGGKNRLNWKTIPKTSAFNRSDRGENLRWMSGGGGRLE